MPALGKARKEAESAVCKSNLKQHGLKSAMYLDDNDGIYYFHYGNWDATQHLDIRNSGMRQCPSEENFDPSGNGGSYGVNNRDPWKDNWFNYPTFNYFAKITNPVKFIMYTDAGPPVVDWAYAPCDPVGRHPKNSHISVMFDGHVRTQTVLSTKADAAFATLKVSSL